MRIPRHPFKKVPLNPKQRRLWEDTLAALSWIAPGMVHIIYTMLANTGDDELALFTEDIQFEAATDGYQLIFKPSGFFARPLMKRVFMVLHEVMHEILNHVRMSWNLMKDGKISYMGKTLPFNQMFANIVQDLGINATLIAAKWGEYDEAWLFDKDLQAEHSTWIELYFQLWKSHPPRRCASIPSRARASRAKASRAKGSQIRMALRRRVTGRRVKASTSISSRARARARMRTRCPSATRSLGSRR